MNVLLSRRKAGFQKVTAFSGITKLEWLVEADTFRTIGLEQALWEVSVLKGMSVEIFKAQ